MKKFIAIIMMAVIAIAMTFSVAAAPGGFIVSPSLVDAPIIVEFYNSDGVCLGTIFVTPYGDRNTLPDDERKNMEAAYESIKGATGVVTLNPDLADLAAALNVDPSNLGVSDLFNLSLDDCEFHDDHGYFSVKLTDDVLSSFVSLMYFENGKWNIVEDAKVEGEYLTFTTDVPRTFAIVVDVDNTDIDVPVTGDIIPWILLGVMVASAAGIVAVTVSYKKKNRA